MNPAAILALIGDLFEQVTALSQENERLRQALAEQSPGDAAEPQIS